VSLLSLAPLVGFHRSGARQGCSCPKLERRLAVVEAGLGKGEQTPKQRGQDLMNSGEAQRVQEPKSQKQEPAAEKARVRVRDTAEHQAHPTLKLPPGCGSEQAPLRAWCLRWVYTVSAKGPISIQDPSRVVAGKDPGGVSWGSRQIDLICHLQTHGFPCFPLSTSFLWVSRKSTCLLRLSV
jgi:hypothetical protein